MYFGHFAIGSAIKGKYQDIPILPVMLGVVFLDLVNGIFLFMGIDKVTPNLAALPYLFFDLTFIDWDHSLLMAGVWSVLYGVVCFAIYKRRTPIAGKIGVIATLAVFSHFVADWFMHNSDLALFPNSETHLGLGLWGSLGVGAWILEILFSGALLVYGFYRSKQPKDWKWLVAFYVILAIQVSPWLSPMKFIAELDPGVIPKVLGGLLFVGFLLPAFILRWIYSRSAAR